MRGHRQRERERAEASGHLVCNTLSPSVPVRRGESEDGVRRERGCDVTVGSSGGSSGRQNHTEDREKKMPSLDGVHDGVCHRQSESVRRSLIRGNSLTAASPLILSPATRDVLTDFPHPVLFSLLFPVSGLLFFHLDFLSRLSFCFCCSDP